MTRSNGSKVLGVIIGLLVGGFVWCFIPRYAPVVGDFRLGLTVLTAYCFYEGQLSSLLEDWDGFQLFLMSMFSAFYQFFVFLSYYIYTSLFSQNLFIGWDLIFNAFIFGAIGCFVGLSFADIIYPWRKEEDILAYRVRKLRRSFCNPRRRYN